MSPCGRRTAGGKRCPHGARFFAHVYTVPQDLVLPDGTTTRESDHAGRSSSVCLQHLGGTVRELYALPIRRPGRKVEVTPL